MARTFTCLPIHAPSYAIIDNDMNFYSRGEVSCASMISDTSLPTPPPEERLLDFESLPELTGTGSVQEIQRPTIAIVGVGYVGLNLVNAFHKVCNVIAYDIDKKRIEAMSSQLERVSVEWTTDATRLSNASYFLISVNTLLHHDGSIDTSNLRESIATIGTYARPGTTIIMESSVAVGMTRQLLSGLMRSKSVKGGMSPERVDPGRVTPTYDMIPKLVSGFDDISPGSLSSVYNLYSRVFKNLLTVSSPEVAEMTKLYENCQRMVGIAYANEMADACSTLRIDANEVTRAASTKPFGFHPYQPSLGVGGHCLPVNPHYLLSNAPFPLLAFATESMRTRPMRVVDRVMQQLKELKACSTIHRFQPRLLVVGVGFKKGQSALTGSPGVAAMVHLLSAWEDVYVEFVDPFVDQEALSWVPKLDEITRWKKSSLEEFDVIIVATDQGLDMDVLKTISSKVIIENFCG